MSKRDDIIKLHQLIYTTGKTLEKVGKEIIFKPYGLTIARFVILHILSTQKDVKMNTRSLQKRLNVSAANMSGRVDVLERDGLVRRISGQDRRTQILQLSAKGKKLINEVEDKNARELTELYNEVSAQQVREYTMFLTKLLHRLQKRGL